MTARSVAALAAQHNARWRWSWVARIAVIAAIAAGLFLVREYLGRPAASPGLQRVRLLNPTLPPPPRPPEEKKPEEKPKPEEEVKLADPAQTSNEPPPMDDRLGVDAEAEGAGDGFGLAAKPGGRAIITLGPPGAGGKGSGADGASARALELAYNRSLRWRLEGYLNNRSELRRRAWTMTVALWISPAGNITAVKLLSPAGGEETEPTLRAALAQMPPLNAPPPGYRQPVQVVLRSDRGR